MNAIRTLPSFFGYSPEHHTSGSSVTIIRSRSENSSAGGFCRTVEPITMIARMLLSVSAQAQSFCLISVYLSVMLSFLSNSDLRNRGYYKPEFIGENDLKSGKRLA